MIKITSTDQCILEEAGLLGTPLEQEAERILASNNKRNDLDYVIYRNQRLATLERWERERQLEKTAA